MNNVRLFFLLYAYCANVTWAFLFHRAPKTPSLGQHLSSKTHHAESLPLLLTPLINAGKLEEARNRSRVSPLKDVESYAGFLTVNETTKSHLYFWFIPKTTTDYTSSPIILWLQGGPGCSSLFGLFTENGPLEVTEKGDIKRRKFAWTNNYHMLYIDQPVGTGFSFTEENKYINSQEEVAEHLYIALVQFFKLFTEFNDHDFYVAGESYGGKYVPSIGHKIHTANQQSDLHHIRLKGMMIGNGYSDPENMLEYAEFLHVTGSIDGNERQQLEVIQERIRNHLESGHWSQASNQFHYLMANVDNFTKLNIYDYTSKNSSADSMDVSYTQVFTDVIRQHIHVGNISYKVVSYEVYYALELDFMQSARSKIEELLDHYPMLFYNGQFDIICAHWLTENYLDKLHWSGATKYSLAKKQIWRVGENVAGYYKSAANLVYVMVRNAGHMVPSDQPENALNLVDMFIEKKLQDNSTHG